MDRVTVRAAEPEDVDVVTTLHLELRDHHGRLQPDNIRYDVETEGWRQITQGAIEEGRVWIAEAAGKVVGFMTLEFVEKPWGISCEVETLVVSEARRGSGVGRIMMRSAEELARARGARGLRVDVLIGNDEALAFYRSLGYQDTAVRMARDL